MSEIYGLTKTLSSPQKDPFALIKVTYPEGATCTCAKGTTVLTAKNTSGNWIFEIPESGTWVLQAVQGSDSDSKSLSINTQGEILEARLSFLPVIIAEIQSHNVGDIITVDGHEFYILSKLYGTSALLRKDCYSKCTYGSKNEYSTSNIPAQCDSFLNTLSQDTKDCLANITVGTIVKKSAILSLRSFSYYQTSSYLYNGVYEAFLTNINIEKTKYNNAYISQWTTSPAGAGYQYILDNNLYSQTVSPSSTSYGFRPAIQVNIPETAAVYPQPYTQGIAEAIYQDFYKGGQAKVTISGATYGTDYFSIGSNKTITIDNIIIAKGITWLNLVLKSSASGWGTKFTVKIDGETLSIYGTGSYEDNWTIPKKFIDGNPHKITITNTGSSSTNFTALGISNSYYYW